uniref:Uncharacterized protein n=1 Tax=Panagrolaimus sp. JU765 TaxID=591449 RepID=A0AC34QV97_9BILA
MVHQVFQQVPPHQAPRLRSPPTCRSYIPFSFDVSTDLSTAQFADLKTFLVNPFLESVFPKDIQPLWYSSYDQVNFPPAARPLNVSDIITVIPTIEQTAVGSSSFTAPLLYFLQQNVANVSNIINFVTNENQGTSPYSFIALPLKYFVDQNVVGYNPWTNVDIVNTVVFAGDSLAVADVPAVKNYTSILTANGNTLTVVLVNPNIDQTNYRNVTGLNIVVWSNPATTIATILSFMNCPFDSSSTATSTSTESTTSPSSTSTTTVTSTSTAATPPTSTSTITSTVVTSPSTSETTTVSTMSTTTTPPIPVCKSYIPFSSDVATDLTATQFVELRTFLVNLFLSELFPLDVQPAWYSTYDTTNHGYDRPYNVSDVINNVQNLIQSTATTSDFIQPLQYFVDQNVPTLGSTNGLPVNSIIFAGSPLNDVDTANFYAPSFTSNGNTLTVVLVNPNINQKNYRNVTGLNIVVWSDPQTTIAAIRAVMNCEPSSSTST